MYKTLSFLALLLMSYSVYADVTSDSSATLAVRQHVTSALTPQNQWEHHRKPYSNYEAYQNPTTKQLTDLFISKIASSFIVCDGRLLVQNINNPNEKPYEIYISDDDNLEDVLSLYMDIRDNSDEFSQADRLNGYQWKGNLDIIIKAPTYRSLNSSVWQNGYENRYKTSSIIYKNNQIIQPSNTQNMSKQEYNQLPHIVLQRFEQYKSPTCGELNNQAQNIERLEKTKKVGAFALSILGSVLEGVTK